MVPSHNKILLDHSYQEASKVELARLLAHEMCHIRQYRRWGTSKFRCEYGEQWAGLVKHGFGAASGRSNSVEKECYQFEDESQDTIDTIYQCFTIENKSATDLWVAFHYFSSEYSEWTATGWRRIDGRDNRSVCHYRTGSTLYAHFFNGGKVRSKYQFSGDHATNCVHETDAFEVVKQYYGYKYWDTQGLLADDSCSSTSGYYKAEFEVLSGAGKVYSGASISGRKLMDAWGVYGEGDGVYGEEDGVYGYGHGGQGDEGVKIVESTVSGVSALLAQSPSDRVMMLEDK